MLYLNYRLRARHRKGRGIHPPFAYQLISGVVYGDDPGNAGLAEIESRRKELLMQTETVSVDDFGAGSRKGLGKDRRISDLVKHTAVSPGTGRLLARLVNHLKPSTIIELGTGTGIATLYLARANPAGLVLTCEGSPAIAGLASQGFQKLGVSNVVIHTGRFDDLLPALLNNSGPDTFFFIDGDHREKKLLSYIDRILDPSRPDIVIVMDDIHWSRGMFRAWKNIIDRPEINLSIELYNTGIIFTGKKIQKNHFVVIF